jgi:hypothetical protein
VKFTFEALHWAAVSEIAPALGPHLAACWDIHKGDRSSDEELTAEDAGLLLAAAVLGRDNPSTALVRADGLTLRTVEIEADDGFAPSVLTPPQAERHPLVRDWFCHSFPESIGKVISAGASRAALASGFAEVIGADVIEGVAGETVMLSAALRLRYPNGVRVVLRFGEPDVPSALVGLCSYGGAVLSRLGLMMADFAEANDAAHAAAREAASAACATPQQSQTRH